MARVAVAYEKGPHSPAVCYALGTVMELLGFDYHMFPLSEISAIPAEDMLVSYGRAVPEIRARKHIHIYRSPLLYESYLARESLPAVPLPRYEGLPLLCAGGEGPEPFLRKAGSRLITNVDIPASTFFMVTRYEERLEGRSDGTGRFPASSSIAFKEGFLSCPVVNRYLDVFLEWGRKLDAGLERRERWKGREFAVCLTHSVDCMPKYAPAKVARGLARQMLRGKPAACLRLLLDALAARRGVKQDPYRSFDFIMNLGERFAMRSSFFIRTDYDAGPERVYSILEAGPSQLVKYILSRGHEVGLLGSAHGSRVPLRMMEERRRLSRCSGRTGHGGRQFQLGWENPVTWRAMVEAGLLYDSSVAFPGVDGFRSGVCLPYRIFDLEGGCEFPLWEVPPTAMDANFLSAPGVDAGEALARLREIISTVKKSGGVFVLDWRSSALETEARRRVYAELVEFLAGQAPYAGTCAGILRRWAQE